MNVVYTYGVFDLLHVGHVKLLEEAARMGDELIVGVFTDEIAETFKRVPIIPYTQRVQLLSSLKSVKSYMAQDDMSPVANLKWLLSNKTDLENLILVKGPGAGYENEFSRIANDLSITAALLSYHEGISTSDIIKKIKEL